MRRREPAIVVGEGGLRGTIEPESQLPPGGELTVIVRLDDGTRVAVPTELMTEQDDGSYYVPIGPADVERLRIRGGHTSATTEVIPVVAEELDVHKRTVETGRVRITKRIHEREEVVDEPLLREDVHVERVAVNRVVDGPVAVRQEGDTTIVPVVEEVLVVEKRLMLKEELRITKRRVEEHRPQRVVLRDEEATVERVAAPARPKTKE